MVAVTQYLEPIKRTDNLYAAVVAAEVEVVGVASFGGDACPPVLIVVKTVLSLDIVGC
jgi:hypothetical protein